MKTLATFSQENEGNSVKRIRGSVAITSTSSFSFFFIFWPIRRCVRQWDLECPLRQQLVESTKQFSIKMISLSCKEEFRKKKNKKKKKKTVPYDTSLSGNSSA